MIVTPDQVRAARALLRMEQRELAERAQNSVATLRRIEAAESNVAAETVERVQTALEAAGEEFIARGVRRRPAATAGAEAEREARILELMAIAERSAALQAGNDFTEDDLYDENGLPA
jgi:transcriptional regulator with XRE-family HTH domain